jgi:hypothetical protein
MKLYCHGCNKFVAEIKSGSHVRKNSKMLCDICISRYEALDKMAKIEQKQKNSNSMPDFFRNIFPGFK